MSEGTDAGANARWSSTGLPRAHHRAGPGSGAADVASLDFFARDQCGRSLLTEVAKNSNAPRAPAGPSASLGTLGMELGLAAGEGSVDGHQKGLG